MKTINTPFFPSVRVSQTAVATLLMAACGIGCGSSGGSPSTGAPRLEGQSEFSSSPPGQNNVRGEGFGSGGRPEAPAPEGPRQARCRGQPTPLTTGGAQSATPRTVEETDLYRVEGDRLYYLNGYRGLMVFDISTSIHPKLIGRSPIFGSPVEMVVHDGKATVVVADWYGTMETARRSTARSSAASTRAIPPTSRFSAKRSSAAGCATPASWAMCSTP